MRKNKQTCNYMSFLSVSLHLITDLKNILKIPDAWPNQAKVLVHQNAHLTPCDLGLNMIRLCWCSCLLPSLIKMASLFKTELQLWKHRVKSCHFNWRWQRLWFYTKLLLICSDKPSEPLSAMTAAAAVYAHTYVQLQPHVKISQMDRNNQFLPA